MKIENIDRVQELIEERCKLADVIYKLKTEEISLSDEDGLPFEILDSDVVEKLIEMYQAKLGNIDAEIEEL